MVNIRERIKRDRIQRITDIVIGIQKKKAVIDKELLIAKMIVEHGISKKTAIEEIEAVLLYNLK